MKNSMFFKVYFLLCLLVVIALFGNLFGLIIKKFHSGKQDMKNTTEMVINADDKTFAEDKFSSATSTDITKISSNEIDLSNQIDVIYRVCDRNEGWSKFRQGGDQAGIFGKNSAVNAIEVKAFDNIDADIKCQTYTERGGWSDWSKSGEISGDPNSKDVLTAIKINIFGDIAKKYDICYRVYIQHYGWLNWTYNANPAGVKNLSLAIKAIEVKLVDKGQFKPDEVDAENIYSMAYIDSPEYLFGDYQINVNKSRNFVTIYKNKVPIKVMICSTGPATPVGEYRVGEKYRWKNLIHNVYGQYSCRITGQILFHSIYYLKEDANTLDAVEYNKLGTSASAGCVRLTCGDAKWIYDYVPSQTPVSIYTDGREEDYDKPVLDKIPETQTYDPTDVEYIETIKN